MLPSFFAIMMWPGVPIGALSDHGAVAKRLCTGLQIRLARFDSAPRLQSPATPAHDRRRACRRIRSASRRAEALARGPRAGHGCGAARGRSTRRRSPAIQGVAWTARQQSERVTSAPCLAHALPPPIIGVGPGGETGIHSGLKIRRFLQEGVRVRVPSRAPADSPPGNHPGCLK